MAQTLQERKDAFKRNLVIFNTGMTCTSIEIGETFNSTEMQTIFEFVDRLNEADFNTLYHITMLTDIDAYDTGYENGTCETQKILKD